jgi:hypothetical protein
MITNLTHRALYHATATMIVHKERDTMRASRYLILVGILVGLIFLQQPTALSANLSEGFSGIKWGTEIGEIKNLIRVGSNVDVEYYINPKVEHTIDGVSVSQVIYGFYDHRLFSAYVHMENIEAFSRMKEQLQALYGVPKIVYGSSGRPSIYRWKSGEIKIKLKVDSSGDKMKAAFYYTPLSNLVNEEHEEAFRESKIKFLPIQRDKTPERLPLLQF